MAYRTDASHAPSTFVALTKGGEATVQHFSSCEQDLSIETSVERSFG